MPTGLGRAPEHRRERRMRVLKMARIVFNGGYSVYDCRVKNLSESGALLEMASLLGIPNRFEIALEATAARRLCTVMWRTDRLMGVAFDQVVGKVA
jgi:PilZ domain-containing protein